MFRLGIARIAQMVASVLPHIPVPQPASRTPRTPFAAPQALQSGGAVCGSPDDTGFWIPVVGFELGKPAGIPL